VSRRIASPPTGFSGSDWLYLTIRCGTAPGDKVEALWKADLIQGAVETLSVGSAANLAAGLSGSSISCVSPDGDVTSAVDAASGDVAANQRFAASDLTDDEINRLVSDAVLKDGFTLESITIIKGAGPAVAVVASLPPEADDRLTLGALRDDVSGPDGRANFEGVYAELRSAQGQIIGRTSASYLTGAGRLWFNPDLEAKVGVAHG
jgi:hypothetical protein